MNFRHIVALAIAVAVGVIGIVVYQVAGQRSGTQASGSAAAGSSAAPAAAASGTVAPAALQVKPTDRVLGNREAPITIVEYASLTCPHCATFHSSVLPKLKTDWIDSGKAKLVYRDFPLDGVALRAAVIAQCMPADRYFAFLDVLYKGQEQWATSPDPAAAISRLARLGGMGQEQIDACVANKSIEEAILQTRIEGSEQLRISGTPSIYVNGRRAVDTSAAGMEELLKAAGN